MFFTQGVGSGVLYLDLLVFLSVPLCASMRGLNDCRGLRRTAKCPYFHKVKTPKFHLFFGEDNYEKECREYDQLFKCVHRLTGRCNPKYTLLFDSFKEYTYAMCHAKKKEYQESRKCFSHEALSGEVNMCMSMKNWNCRVLPEIVDCVQDVVMSLEDCGVKDALFMRSLADAFFLHIRRYQQCALPKTTTTITTTQPSPTTVDSSEAGHTIVSNTAKYRLLSNSASSGNRSNNTGSDNRSNSTSSGNRSNSTSSGDRSNSTSSGNRSNNTGSGNRSNSTSSGNRSNSTNSGDRSNSTSSIDRSNSTSSGNRSNSTSSGNRSNSTSSGNRSNSTSSGNSTNSGDRSNSTSNGKPRHQRVTGSHGNNTASISDGRWTAKVYCWYGIVFTVTLINQMKGRFT